MNDQYIIPLFVAGSLLLALFTFFLIAYLLVQKRKQNKYLLEKQKMVFDHENNILRTKIEEQENAMDQISKELHGNLKSKVGHAVMYLGQLDDTEITEFQIKVINQTNAVLREVTEDLRNISHSMNSNFVKKFGLEETITKELEIIRLSKNITYNVETTGTPITLSPEKNLYVYRIAQEAIQNCIKHSKATNLNFILNFEPATFVMKIADNGVGFDKVKAYDLKGLGFLNMFQRARYVHGSLEVQSAPMEGCAVILTLNLKKDGFGN